MSEFSRRTVVHQYAVDYSIGKWGIVAMALVVPPLLMMAVSLIGMAIDNIGQHYEAIDVCLKLATTPQDYAECARR